MNLSRISLPTHDLAGWRGPESPGARLAEMWGIHKEKRER